MFNFKRINQEIKNQIIFNSVQSPDVLSNSIYQEGTLIGGINNNKLITGTTIDLGLIDLLDVTTLKTLLMEIGSFFEITDFTITISDDQPDLQLLFEQIATKTTSNDDSLTYDCNTQFLPATNTEFPNAHYGHVVFSNYSMTTNDDVIGVVTAYGDVTITLPDIVKLGGPTNANYFWQIYKMSNDDNKVYIVRENAEQSFQGSNCYTLHFQGHGVEVKMYREAKKYWFLDATAKAVMESAHVDILKPIFNTNELTMRGFVSDMANNDYVYAQFRYRSGEDQSWIDTIPMERTSYGEFSLVVTVPESFYQVQLITMDVNGAKRYSPILGVYEIEDYYPNIESAKIDNMFRYWPLTEHTGTNDVGIDYIDGDNLNFYNNTTWEAININGVDTYMRSFGTTSYGESSKFKFKKNTSCTIMLQFKTNNSSGDHTIFSMGQNVLSLATDNTTIQIESNGALGNWLSATPINSLSTFFIVIDEVLEHVCLWQVTDEAIKRCIVERTPTANGIYFRLGRGSAGDANHQDYEYMADGCVRMIGMWDKVLTENKMLDIGKAVNNGGSLVHL